MIVLSQLGLVQQIVDQVLHHNLRLGRLQLADGDGHVLPEYAVLVHMIGTQAAAPIEWLWGCGAAVASTGHCNCIQRCGAGGVATIVVVGGIVVVVVIIGSA